MWGATTTENIWLYLRISKHVKSIWENVRLKCLNVICSYMEMFINCCERNKFHLSLWPQVLSCSCLRQCQPLHLSLICFTLGNFLLEPLGCRYIPLRVWLTVLYTSGISFVAKKWRLVIIVPCAFRPLRVTRAAYVGFARSMIVKL